MDIQIYDFIPYNKIQLVTTQKKKKYIFNIYNQLIQVYCSSSKGYGGVKALKKQLSCNYKKKKMWLNNT